MKKLEELEGFDEAWLTFEAFLRTNGFYMWQRAHLLALISQYYEQVSDDKGCSLDEYVEKFKRTEDKAQG